MLRNRKYNHQHVSRFGSKTGFVNRGVVLQVAATAITTRRNMEQLLYTPEEVAAALHVGRRKIYELMQSGEIESVKIGRCRRIPSVALVRFLAQLRDEAGSR